jgi:hypothetical protein
LIEMALLKGESRRKIAKDCEVSEGTVANVRATLTLPEDTTAEYHRRESQEVAAKYKVALVEIDKLNKELSLFTTVSDWSRNFQPVVIQPKHGGKGEATAMIGIGDWHYEEQVTAVEVNGVNEFNLDIARRRTVRLFQSAASLVDMCRSRSKIDTVIVMLLGDMINNWIHDEYVATNNLTPPQAVLRVFEDLVSGLDFLAKETKAKEIIVPCVCGNHGRITKKIMSKKRVETNLDWLIYQLVARWFEARGNKQIRFLLPQGDMTYLKVYQYVIRLAHGDNIRYSGGVGGVHIPLRKAIDNWNTSTRADLNYFGHYHTDLTGEDYRMVGSLIGFNEYSIKIKARFQRPSQAFEIIHPRYGATARFPIILE